MKQKLTGHADVSRTGSVKKRAHVLHKALEDTRELLNRDINFVAHSMVRPLGAQSFSDTG